MLLAHAYPDLFGAVGCHSGLPPGAAGYKTSAIIAMAHELGLVVVAEGVETPVQRRYLVAHGCDILQGYLFGKPQSAEAFRRLLKGEPAGELVCAL